MNLILASGSQRRKEILDLFHKEYKIQIPYIDESIDYTISSRLNTMSIAYKKAKYIQDNNKNDNAIIISADTIVCINEKMFGKPENEADAISMLIALSGKKHIVITGFCILHKKNKLQYIDCVSTEVYFKNITESQILRYINTDDYIGKAGSYAIQGIASIFVDKIEGDYFNVVGLPISEINEILEKKFFYNLL